MSSAWLEWLVGLFNPSGWWGPAPGTHESHLEEQRLGALLVKEQVKPPGQQDEELVHRLQVQYRQRQLWNSQVGGRVVRGAAAGRRSRAPSLHHRRKPTIFLSFIELRVRLMHACAPALQAFVEVYGRTAEVFALPVSCDCCAARGWVWQRVAASNRALEEYSRQMVQQVGREREGATG